MKFNSLFLPGSYSVDVDLGDNLIFRFEDYLTKKFGIFFFDDIGIGLPIFSIGYCTDLTDVRLYVKEDRGEDHV